MRKDLGIFWVIQLCPSMRNFLRVHVEIKSTNVRQSADTGRLTDLDGNGFISVFSFATEIGRSWQEQFQFLRD
jgi:hypothetical protein